MMQRLHDNFPALCRLYAGGDAIVSWYNSFSDPLARLARIAKTQDGGVLIWIMALFGLAIVLDVLINDWTPAAVKIGSHSFRLVWERAFEYRHWLFIALGLCYAAQPFVAERAGYGVSLLLFFYWNAVQNIAIAFLDARYRLRSPGWRRACN